jgi:hypothetical protein
MDKKPYLASVPARNVFHRTEGLKGYEVEGYSEYCENVLVARLCRRVPGGPLSSFLTTSIQARFQMCPSDWPCNQALTMHRPAHDLCLCQPECD